MIYRVFVGLASITYLHLCTVLCVFLRQSWDVFQEITEILILVPAVLGMKGNLEMTLASRLSTAVSVEMQTQIHKKNKMMV